MIFTNVRAPRHVRVSIVVLLSFRFINNSLIRRQRGVGTCSFIVNTTRLCTTICTRRRHTFRFIRVVGVKYLNNTILPSPITRIECTIKMKLYKNDFCFYKRSYFFTYNIMEGYVLENPFFTVQKQYSKHYNKIIYSYIYTCMYPIGNNKNVYVNAYRNKLFEIWQELCTNHISHSLKRHSFYFTYFFFCYRILLFLAYIFDHLYRIKYKPF